MKKNQSRSAIATAGKKFRTKNISKRVRKIVISPIKEMSILADQLEEKIGKGKIISFGQGIPYLDTPSYIKQAIKKSLNEKSTASYTLEPGITELRQLIAKHLQNDKNIKNVLAKKEIMVSTGAQEALACALATVIDPDDEVLIVSPAFASHIEQVIQFGGVPKFILLDEKEGWALDIKECEKKISRKTKAIILSHPSNPTGKVLNKKEISNLAKFVKKHNLILVTDETYDFLTYDKVEHISPASMPNIRDCVILVGSFSKKYRVTGYRIGYAFADEGIIDHMLKVHDALTICAPAISQKAIIAAFKNKKESSKSIANLKKTMSSNRELMCKELDKLSDIFEYQKPMGAYYILVKVSAKGGSASGRKIPKINSFKLSLKILEEAHIITIPGAAFGPNGEGHLRFSFAGETKDIKKGFQCLQKWAKQWKKENYKL